MITRACIAACIYALTCIFTPLADAGGPYTGRRAVLLSRINLLLAENPPWRNVDCSSAAWRALSDVFPELRTTRWFRRTTADAMAGWPWTAVMSLDRTIFGDLLFSGTPRIDHVMITWTDPKYMTHASKSRGFVCDPIRPYWAPKIQVIVRPPY